MFIRSLDNGSTWSNPRKIIDKADVGCNTGYYSLPNIDTAILPNGTIVLLCDANTTAMPQLTPIIYLESHNDGQDWSEPLNVTCIKAPEAYKARIQVDAEGDNFWLMWRARNVTSSSSNNSWAEFSTGESLGTDVPVKVAERITGNFDFIRDIDGHFRLFEIKSASPKPNNTQWFCSDFATNSWTKNQILPRIEELDNLVVITVYDFCLAFDGHTEHYFYSGSTSGGDGTCLYQYTYVYNRTFWERTGNFTAGILAQASWNGRAETRYPINSSRVKVNFLGQNSSYTPYQISSSLYINLDNLDPTFSQYMQKQSYLNPHTQNLEWIVASSESASYKLEIYQNQTQLSPWRFITDDNFDQARGILEIMLSTTGQLYVIYCTLMEGVEELSIIRSSDGGVSWTTPTTILITSGSIGGIAAATYADIVVVIANCSVGVLTQCQLFRSFDQGDTFESPITLTPPLFPVSNHNLESCAFSRNGTLFTGFTVLAQDTGWVDYSLGEFHVLRSDDFGLTWSESQMWYLNPAYNETTVQPAFVGDPYNDLIHVCFPQNNYTGDFSNPDQYDVANYTFSTFNMSTQEWSPLIATGDFSICPYEAQPQFILWQDDQTENVTAKLFFIREINMTAGIEVIYNEIESEDLGATWSFPQASSLTNFSIVAVEAGAFYYVSSVTDGNDQELILSRESRKIRTQEGSIPPAQDMDIIYDGKDDDGLDLPAENYTFRLTLIDNAGNREDRSGWFYIDYTNPSISECPSLNWSVLATPRFDVNVSVQVTDDIGIGVWLHYQKGVSTWQNISMTKTGGEQSTTYYAIIPGDISTTSVKYFVTATDAAGNKAVRNNEGANYEFHMPSIRWTAIGLFNSTVEYSSNQNYEFSLTLTEDAQFVNQVIFHYSFDGNTWHDQVLVASANKYSGSLQNLPGDLKTLQYQILVIDAFDNEVVLLSTQLVSFHPEIPSVIFSDLELTLVLITSLVIGIAVALGYMKLKHASHRVVSQQILVPTERAGETKEPELSKRKVNDKDADKEKKASQKSKITPVEKPRSPFSYVYLIVFIVSIIVLAAGLQIANLSPTWAVVTLAASLLLGVFGFMILSSRDIAENIYSEKIRYSNVFLEFLQVGILLWIIISILQTGYMIPWFRYYLIDATYDFFGFSIPKLYVSVIGVFFTSLVVVLISTYWELRNTVRNIQRQKKDSGLSGIALLYIKDEHSNRMITNMGIKTVVFLITVLITVISTTDLLNFENIIALAAVLGPFALGSLFVLMIQPAVTKRKEKAMRQVQIPFVEAEKVCAKCGAKNFLSNRYCKACGTQQVFEQVVGQYNTRCVQCGGLISKETTFCTSCGTKTASLKFVSK